MTRSGVRSGFGLACVMATALGLLALAPPTSGAAPMARANASGSARVAIPLPAGLSAPEHAALERFGAFGPHPVRLLILGDSIALTLGMGLSERSQTQYGVAVSDHGSLGCDLDPQLPVFISGRAGPATQGCALWRGLWPLLAAKERPQVVALGLGRWEVADHQLDGQWVHIGEPSWDLHLTADLQSAVAIFHSIGARVVLFTMPYVDPSNRQPDGMPWSENAPTRVQAYNVLVRRVAQADPGEVSVIDLNRMLSRDGGYAASLDGVVVRWPDGVHISAAGGQLLQREILPEIDHIGMENETAVRSQG